MNESDNHSQLSCYLRMRPKEYTMHGQGCGRRFRGGEFRLTSAREVILNIISEKGDHLTVEEIFLSAKNVYHSIGLATVYRTLELLTNTGIVKKLDFGDGMSRYELVKDNKKGHHHHLVCKDCGKVIDYTELADKEKVFIGKLEEKLRNNYNFKIDSHQIRFYGLCEKCK